MIPGDVLRAPALRCHNRTINMEYDKVRYRACLSVNCETLEALRSDPGFLHPEEKVYYDNLCVDRRRMSFLLGRKSAKQAIAELTGHTDLQSIAITYGVFQFPVVKGPFMQSVQVSISHSDDAGIALAFPEAHPMAIDIESVRDHKCQVMKGIIGEAEARLIEAADLPYAIGSTLLWTIKEAFSKVIRTGLTIDFKLIEIKSIEVQGQVFISYFTRFLQYKAISFQWQNYICSIVLPKHTVLDMAGIMPGC